MLADALYYRKMADQRVRCELCPHSCIIGEGKKGLCGVRVNETGKLRSLVYRNISALQVDPIEKKPLYHFLPGTKAFSLATQGCNLNCPFCQNHSLSLAVKNMDHVSGEYMEPVDIVKMAWKSNSDSICYTYSEPTIYYETMIEIAEEAKKSDLRNCMISNGYISSRPLQNLIPFLDAANIDLKCYSAENYKKILDGNLEIVKSTIKEMKGAGVWVEVTTLLIPGFNDREDELMELTGFIAGISPDIPWHVSRYHPVMGELSDVPTPEEKILQAIDIGEQQGLRYIYAGNIRVDRYNDTRCLSCGKTLIKRDGFLGIDNRAKNSGECPACNTQLPGVYN